jgi:hypothetical protein
MLRVLGIALSTVITFVLAEPYALVILTPHPEQILIQLDGLLEWVDSSEMAGSSSRGRDLSSFQRISVADGLSASKITFTLRYCTWSI